MLLRITILVAAVLGLTACIHLKPNADITKMYALGFSGSTEVDTTTSIKKGYILRPQLPVYMEGPGLKIRSVGSEIRSLPGVRWAEPMDAGIARALSHYIEAAGGGLKSDFYPWVQTEEYAFELHLNFHSLIATEEGRILLSADWQYECSGDVIQSGSFTSDTVEWLPKDAQSMVVGINRALELLAIEIVNLLKKEHGIFI